MEQQHQDKSNILFVIPNLNGGGAERVFVNYIRILDEQKYNISLALVEKTGPYLDLVPAYVKIIDFKKKRTRYSFFNLLKSIKQVNPDLVVSTTNYMNMLLLFPPVWRKFTMMKHPKWRKKQLKCRMDRRN